MNKLALAYLNDKSLTEEEKITAKKYWMEQYEEKKERV